MTTPETASNATTDTATNNSNDDVVKSWEESVDDLRQRGNYEFQQGHYENAVSLYSAAIDVTEVYASPHAHSHASHEPSLPAVTEEDEEEEEEDNATKTETAKPTAAAAPVVVLSKADDIMCLLLCNRSAAYYQMQQYESACFDAMEALKVSKHASCKAGFRLAKAQVALEQWQSAKETIQMALALVHAQQAQLTESDSNDEEQKTKKKLLDSQLTSLQDLWSQVLKEAYTQPHVPPQHSQHYSIKHVKRPVSIREFTKNSSSSRTLGIGNFSEVIVVTHKETHEPFALKMILKSKAADLAKRQHPNVYNEIQMERRVLLERLHGPNGLHPNIVQMYHAFQDYTTIYYLMDLHTVNGDLWSRLRWQPAIHTNDNNSSVVDPFSATAVMVGAHRSQAVAWMDQLVDAVQHMHAHGIVHRDLKAENILLNAHNHVVVIDFGTAKDLLQPDLNGPEFVGTPDFMSPEQVTGTSGSKEVLEAVQRGAIGAVHTADLWALGAILFCLQTGHTPFWSQSPYLAFLKIKRCLLTRATGIVDDEAWDLIRSLMQLEPTARLGANAFELQVDKITNQRSMIQKDPRGYHAIRNHAYFQPCRENESLKRLHPIPSLRDLCVRAVAQLAHRDSLDLDLCDAHPPGDGSSHDMMRLSPRDRACVLHVLNRQKLLQDARLYARFFTDPVACRLESKILSETREVVGLTQMNDGQGKAPHVMNDPHATPVELDTTIDIVHITNPLFLQQVNESCSEEARKVHIKALKRSIATINRERPKLVVATGYLDLKCRKLLARISDSIPTVIHTGEAFFTFWIMGVQCVALSSSLNLDGSDETEQVLWLRQCLEQVRMSKHPLFCFANDSVTHIPLRIQKNLARGRCLALFGLAAAAEQGDEAAACKIQEVVQYHANEVLDDVSIRSTDSEEDNRDEFSCQVHGTCQAGLRWITVEETPDSWLSRFQAIELDDKE